MTRLTTNQVLKLTGLTPRALKVAVDIGLVRPRTNKVGGRGKQREYSVPEAVALKLGGVMRDAGWHGSAVKEVIEYVANMSDRELAKQIDSGATILFRPPLKDSQDAIWLEPGLIANHSREARLYCATHDIAAIYDQVMKAAELPRQRNGRG